MLLNLLFSWILRFFSPRGVMPESLAWQSGISHIKPEREVVAPAKMLPPMRIIKLLSVAPCLALAMSIFPIAAQAQWGQLYPDGSIRGRGGIIITGPDPGRILNQQLELPTERRSIDIKSGTIYKGGLIESGPDPSRRLAICLQLAICH